MQSTLRVLACVASLAAALDSTGGSFEALWARSHGASVSRQTVALRHEAQGNGWRFSSAPAPSPVAAPAGSPGPSPGPSPGDEYGVAVSFGDTRCPCIGFDNIEGETSIVFEDDGGKEIAAVSYPADLGARCEAWDDRKHYDCHTPTEDNEWCRQQWCYVDPCDCHIPVLPKRSTYAPDTTYRGKPLFYSYATCGGKDMWTKALPEVGTPGCRCINFDNVPGNIQMEIEGQLTAYPAEVGGTCSSWDKELHPLCKSDKPPKWCTERWCYVDPCSCSLPKDTPPKVSSYLPEATFTGKSIYYSYETCGAKDYYTEDFNKVACVNQDTEEKCGDLPRCAWTGSKCLGAELINHPLCGHMSEEEEIEKSGAARSAGACSGALLAILGVERLLA